MIRPAVRSLFAAALGALVLAAAGSGRAAPTEKDKKLLKDVADRLLAHCDPVPGMDWPPDIAIEPGGEVNAYATVTRKDGKLVPVVRVYEGMMTKVIDGDRDKLAYVVGHELGHILKKHVIANDRAKTPFVKNVFGRDEEDEADAVGVELLLKAGFSLKKGLGAVTRMQDLGLEYSSFEGRKSDHRSWNERLAKMDKDKAQLWKASAAFLNGVVFLTTEQFKLAEQCFDKVTQDFPNCHEAWANLGYARLMQYCDMLRKEDLDGYGIGQIVTGGFYHRADSIKVREKNTKMWWDAVGALRESNRIKPGQTLVLANLGLAYLVHPDGKDVGESTRFLAEAAEAAKADKALDPADHAGLLINLGVATLAAGNEEKALARLDEGEKAVRSLAARGTAARATPQFDAALLYTRALVLAGKPGRGDREKAAGMLEEYLRKCSTLSLWWPVAYDRYAEVSKALNREPKPQDAFVKAQPPAVRLVVGVKLKSGALLTLADDPAELPKKVGPGKETVAVPGTGLKRIRYEAEGVEVLANEDDVLAIFLVGPAAPAIPLQGQMVGAKAAGELKVGMSAEQVEDLLGTEYKPCEITATGVYYRFYREQGVGFLVRKGRVEEVVIVQMPKSKP
jgi:tetratricopeptide (TPR) repeat protein